MTPRTLFRTSALAALLSVGAGGAATAVAGPVVWDTSAGGNGNSYEVVVDNSIAWDAAQGSAEAGGGYLATINSQAEQDFVQSVLSSSNAPTGSYWFGLRETVVEGNYQNFNGEPLTFSHWYPGEPNNSQGVEQVGALLWTADGGDASLLPRRGAWNDEPLSGYPAAGLTTPLQADVLRGGYLVERTAADTGGDGGGDDGGTPNAVPLPAAALTFPLGAAFAGVFYRRTRRQA
jgi:hypothetical protein